MKLSVVIVNYNVAHFLHQCIVSVQDACKHITHEIWVVDNASSDNSVAMVKAHFPEIHCIANTDNVGFSAANNQALRQCTGEYVLILNPDTLLPEDCFEKLFPYMESKQNLGAVGIKMIDGRGEFLPESKRGIPTPEVALYKMLGLNKLFPTSKKFGKYHLGHLDKDQNHPIEILSGAFMCVPKKVLDKVGLFDEAFFMYGEDIDLSYRILEAGFQNYYFAETPIIHYKGESTKRQTANYVRIFYNAMIIFAEKHFGKNQKLLFTGLIKTAIYLRATLALLITFFQNHWQKLIEISLLSIGLFNLIKYWETHIKYIKSYPDEMYFLHLPMYVSVWFLTLLAAGSYRQYFNIPRLIKSMLLGLMFILVFYALLPIELRFSRGIILFGTLVTSATLVVFRSLVHWGKYKSFSFSQSRVNKILLVGNPVSWKLVRKITLSQANNHLQLIGFASGEKSKNRDYLGEIETVPELQKLFQANELIFDLSEISAKKAITWMTSIGKTCRFYTIPAHKNYLIGSHGKNESGMLLHAENHFAISSKAAKYQKRRFDVAVLVFAWIFTPLGFWNSKLRQILAASNAIWTKKSTIIGYKDASNTLPKSAPCVFVINEGHETLEAFQIAKTYAQYYTPSVDFRYLTMALLGK